MKRILFTLAALFFILTGKAQTIDTTKNNAKQEDKVFVSVEKAPEFPGGMEQFWSFLAKTMRYPAKAREQNIQGIVILQMVVEKDGSLSNIQVVRGVSEDLDREAIRLMKLSPKWMPGMQNGQAVRTQYTVPIGFALAN